MKYLDIETVSAFPHYDAADERTQDLFFEKFKHDPAILAVPRIDGQRDFRDVLDVLMNLYYEKAGLFAEFNKIVCVSFGWVNEDGPFLTPHDAQEGKTNTHNIEFKSFYQLDEKALLTAVGAFLKDEYSLCAHFGKGFDFPVLSRKFLMHGLPLPACLDNIGKKPWEIGLTDTAELWKFGDMRHTCSLDLLAHSFGLPSPKTVMHGADVSRVYHTEGIEGLKKIVEYCEQGDVRTLINVHRKMTSKAPIL